MSQNPDPETDKQQQRLREIYDARQQVAERKRRAFELLATNQLSYELASRFFQEAVETYLIESEQVISNHLPDTTDDREDWSDREELAYQVWYESELGEIHLNSGTRTFSGLLEFLRLDGSVTDSWFETGDLHVGTADREKKSETRPIPMHISKRAWRVCNYWWAEVGMDFELPDEEEEVGFTYEDIEKVKNGEYF